MFKNITKYILIFVGIIATFCSCDKVPMNGYLDGMWQVMEVEHNGTTTPMKEKQYYISFQLHTVQFTYYGSWRYYGTFEHKGNMLNIKNLCKPSKYENGTDDNVPFSATDISTLNPWGIFQLDPCFQVEKLTSDSLIISTSDTRIVLRKF